MSGVFVSLEGVEGAGKSTVIKALTEYFASRSQDIVFTREPGGTPIAEKIRSVLLDEHPEPMHDDCELLLVYAARVQHWHTIIRPSLETGKHVVCDRFTDATFAYQGAGRGLPMARIHELDHWAMEEQRPDLTIFLDLPVAVGRERTLQRDAIADRIEREDQEFFEAVRQGYLALVDAEPERFRVVDATAPADQVCRQVIGLVEEALDGH
jgi:dTMP kinase